ncbi:hypothetical protein PAPYR_563 [Paratrimastix pyriformis]|uniref:Uncharacterized protein n=1 Tax=Paratrimastix pyriformis TaxID=342808 RepID=A0ABQ8UTX2_9EUKA|nr:hypothetical protein PAPYR_563 [Paratrimastix pyriformis]
MAEFLIRSSGIGKTRELHRSRRLGMLFFDLPPTTWPTDVPIVWVISVIHQPLSFPCRDERERTKRFLCCHFSSSNFLTRLLYRVPACEDEIDRDFLRAPLPELLRAIMEASPCPLHAYIQLLSLSHAIRQSIRGTLRELSFGDPPNPALAGITPAVTTDAMAAIVGPCKSLRKLTFPEGWKTGTPPEDAASAGGWVDEAFGGHPQLAVLSQLPVLPESTIVSILNHLPGLAVLTATPCLHMSTVLLAALAHSCPGLQVLRCNCDYGADFSVLAPLSGSLHELDTQGALGKNLAALVRSLSVVTRLKIPRCPPAVLEPIATHLTSLEQGDPTGLPGPWLCHLETLSLSLDTYQPFVPLAQLLDANQATLRKLILKFHALESAEARSLGGLLHHLPHLTHLDLAVEANLEFRCCALSAFLLSDLVDRLECLNLNPVGIPEEDPGPVHLASSRLQRLHLRAEMRSSSGLVLDCPALVELDMNGRLIYLQCPRLRTLRAPAVRNMGGAAPMPMPDLEVAAFRGKHLVEDPAWLLAGSSPRLRTLTRVRLTQPDLLAGLCACRSLVRLEELHLDATPFPNPLVLRLPGQLERLDLYLDRQKRDQQLQVEAPGLLDLDLTLHGSRVVLHNCPRLVRLGLQSPAGAAVISLQADDDEGAGMMQLRSLIAADLDAASLLGLLTRHGSRLHVFSARRLQATVASGEVWPQLMQALSGLPRLAGLMMDVSGAPSPLSLACPQLRSLVLSGLPDEAKIVLACPMLEQLGGIKDLSRQVELALPAPKLRPMQGLSLKFRDGISVSGTM